jgi:tRNA modification GTPase
MSMHRPDPIVAIATAPGRGAVGIVRASGPDLSSLVMALCGRPLRAREASYLPFLDAQGQAMDHGLALHFPAPHSFTGEDVLELQAHGGSVVLQMLLARCLQAGQSIGLRLAQPGEFTQRAFLNDKMDLAQAEAVADLIDASTETAARSAVRSLSGDFSAAVHGVRDALIDMRMLIEATLDFPEEEIDILHRADVRGRLARLREAIAAIGRNARQGVLLREGIKVVIAGQPNAGKSSLLNALAGTDAAIVTDIPGTTRDVLRETIQLDGLPLNIIDTAGLRESPDVVEQEGIRRAWAEMEKADLLLVVADASQPAEASLEQLLPGNVQQLTKLRAHQLLVLNKLDLCSMPPQAPAQLDTIAVSAKTGTGMDTLRERLKDLAGYHQVSGTGTFSARRRHLDALRQAEAALQRGHTQLQQHQAGELLAEDLRAAQQALEEITGAFSSDDLLGRIFSSFCIGK